MPKYVLTLNAQVQLNKSELDKINRQINQSLRKGAKKEDVFNFLQTQKQLRQIERAVTRIRGANLGDKITKQLVNQANALKKLAKDPNALVEKLNVKYDLLTTNIGEAIRQQRKLNKAIADADKLLKEQANQAARLAKARDIRANLTEQRIRAKSITRSLSEEIQRSSLPFSEQSRLLDRFLGLDRLAKSKSGRRKLQTALQDIRSDFGASVNNKKEADKLIKAQTDQASRKARAREIRADIVAQRAAAKDAIRSLNETIQRANIPGADQSRLLDRFLGIDQLTKGKFNRKKLKTLLNDIRGDFSSVLNDKKDSDKDLRDREAANKRTQKLDEDLRRIDEKRQKDIDDRNRRAQAARNQRVGRESLQGAFGAGRQTALAFRRFGAFSIAAGALYEIGVAFREAFSEAVKFQDQMVTLAQVANTSTANLGTFRDEITRLATGLGVSSDELANSAVVIAQAGFSIRDTQKALSTLAKTQLSPSFNDLNNTTEGLIAVRSQFGVTADEFESVFGRINAVSKAFAVESEDIITAIRKTGGAFKASGGDLDELVALFTAVRSTTRESADSIATGFRTIFGRFQRPALIEELKKFNIDLTDEFGNFRGPLEAVKEISRGLSGLEPGNLQLARIVEQLGGVRQLSKTIPLIQQIGEAQRALNVAKLGSNSLDEDAVRKQESLQNQLNKTKESFLALFRAIGDKNTALGSTFTFLNTSLQKFFDLLSENAGLLTPFAALFAGKTISTGSSFLSGFGQNLNLSGGRKSTGGRLRFTARQTAGDLGTIFSKKDLTFGQKFALGNRRTNGLFGAAAIGAIAGGSLLASSSLRPTSLNRGNVGRRNAADTIDSALTGGLTGAGIGSLFGPVGAGVGAVVGTLVLGIKGFVDSVDQANQELKEADFKLVFDNFKESLSLISSGKISPLGQGGNVRSALTAIKDRRFTATGEFRANLEGEVRNTVDQLLVFNQKLADSAESIEQFRVAGGADSLKFLSENTSLKFDELEKEVIDLIQAKQTEKALTDQLVKSQQRLLDQANLINSFSAAIKDATDAANGMFDRFNFSANTFAGGTGSSFTGRAGFNTVFGRPTQVSNLGQFGRVSQQLEGFLGPQFKGLANQNVGAASIFRQLPQILSEFALQRPSGQTNNSIEDFVSERLRIIAGQSSSGISLDPIIDAIAANLSQQSAEIGGQAGFVEKILGDTNGVARQLIDSSGFDNLFAFQEEAAQQFSDQFNAFASGLKTVTDREIELRGRLADNIQNLASRQADVAQLRDPRGRIRDDLIQAGNTQAQEALLKPFGLQARVNNPEAILQALERTQGQARSVQGKINEAADLDQFRQLTEDLGSLQEEAAALSDAFRIATDTTARRSRIEQQLADAQKARQQITSGATDFVFGNRQQRNQLNFGAGLLNVVAGGGLGQVGARFNALANVPGDANRELPGQLLEFLQKFSNVDLPGVGNLADIQREIVRSQLEPIFTELARANGIRDPEAAGKQAALQAADQAVLDKEQKLLDDLAALNLEDFRNAEKLRALEEKNNKKLVDDLQTAFGKFVTDLRSNLLEQQKAGLQSGLLNQGNQREALLKQSAKFQDIINIGGSTRNVDNLQALELAKRLRDNQENASVNARGLNILETASSQSQLSARDRVLGGLLPKEFQTGQGIITKDLNFARSAAEEFAENLATKLNLQGNDRNRLFKTASSSVADNTGTFGNINLQNIEDAILNDALAVAREQRSRRVAESGELAQQLQALPADLAAFASNLAQLSDQDFKKFSSNIRDLGTTEFPKLLDEIKALNGTISELERSIRKINAIINGGNNPGIQPFAANDGVNNFINQSNALASAMDNFPRNVELTANHKVEVVINGAQVLSNLMPAIEELIIGSTNEAIANMTKKKFPGSEALG